MMCGTHMSGCVEEIKGAVVIWRVRNRKFVEVTNALRRGIFFRESNRESNREPQIATLLVMTFVLSTHFTSKRTLLKDCYLYFQTLVNNT